MKISVHIKISGAGHTFQWRQESIVQFPVTESDREHPITALDDLTAKAIGAIAEQFGFDVDEYFKKRFAQEKAHEKAKADFERLNEGEDQNN